MTDNTTLNPGAGGDTIRTIARGSSKTEVVQIDIGGESAENLVVGYMPVQDGPAEASLTTIATNTAQGTAATGVTMPTGGVGLFGWLSGIYSKLAGTLTVNTITGFALETGGNLAAILAKLNGSIAVTGAYQATQPVSAAALPLPSGAAIASLQAAINGDGGSLAHITNFPATATPTTSTQSRVSGAASATSILSANASRKRMIIVNESTAIAYLLIGTGTVSATNYTYQLNPYDQYETSIQNEWQGAVYAIWSSATGFMQITEMS